MSPSFSFGLPGFSTPIDLGLGGTATQVQDWHGASFGASGAGDWNVNLGGSGTALQSSASGLNWLLIAAGVGAWLLLKKK